MKKICNKCNNDNFKVWNIDNSYGVILKCSDCNEVISIILDGINDLNKVLIEAVKKNDLEVVKLCIENGADVNTCYDGITSFQPIVMYSIMLQHFEIFKYLINSENINLKLKSSYISKLSGDPSSIMRNASFIIDNRYKREYFDYALPKLILADIEDCIKYKHHFTEKQIKDYSHLIAAFEHKLL